MHAAEDDDVGVGLSGLSREAEGIADEIGDVLDFGHLVIVGEDDGIELFLERKDFAAQRLGLGARHGRTELEAGQSGR